MKIEINPVTYSMASQIRNRQLATKASQDNLRGSIVEYWESDKFKDVSGEGYAKSLLESLSKYETDTVGINDVVSQEDPSLVGYPIRYNKTHLQIQMAREWVEKRGEGILSDIKNGRFYNCLGNDLPWEELPMQGAPNNENFWGNENSSVSTVLLYSINHNAHSDCRFDTTKLRSTATFYPFYDAEYRLEVPEDYPFATNTGFVLFGDFQFGGHRYFSNEHPGIGQNAFAPEDCSSAVGKATELTESQVVAVNTTKIKEAYQTQSNEYGYTAITDSYEGRLNMELIEEGDVFAFGGHCGVVATKLDKSSGEIVSLEFTRDIDCPEGKMLGGGTRIHNLLEMSKVPNKPLYILRSSVEKGKEEASLPDILAKIDEEYYTMVL